jgi:hypothetical protein
VAEALAYDALLDAALERQRLGRRDFQGLLAGILRFGFRHSLSSSNSNASTRPELTRSKVGCEGSQPSAGITNSACRPQAHS